MIITKPFFIYLIFIALPLMIFLLIVSRKKYNIYLEKFGDKNLLEHLFPNYIKKQNRTRNILYIFILIFFLLTLSDIRFGSRLIEIKQKTIDVIIAIDCSKSMLAEDIKPNRITKAKELFANLVEKLKGNRIGVVAFSGIAFTQCPLTFDYNACKMLLGLIDTDLIPYPGTAIGKAIELCIKNFGQTEKFSYKTIVLLTDGEDHDSNPIGYLSQLKESGIKVYTIGIGTENGEPIPEKDINGKVIDYKKDKKGGIVVSKLDETLLLNLASQTGGKYYPFIYSEEAIVNDLTNEISKIEKQEQKSKLYELYEPRFQYPLFILIVLLIIELLTPFIPEFIKNLKKL